VTAGRVTGDAPDLAEIDLVVFDKDGTLIDFDTMWAGWAVDLARALEEATGEPQADRLFAAIGFSADAGRAAPSGPLGSHSMAQLRRLTVDTVVASGRSPADAERIVAAAWRPPDPVGLAVPLADLAALFRSLRAGGRRIAVATGDDRGPTETTLRALGLFDMVDAVATPDDGHPTKPDPAMLVHLCATLGVDPARTAMVGDASVDLEMARTAGFGLVVGVLSGASRRADLEPLADVLLDSVADLVSA
jgi:phosphoglycolate phosphatase